MTGWIKLHRSIKTHWIFNNAEKLKAWLCILIEVNHAGKKVLIGESVMICNRGESLKSLDSWAKIFGNGWNKSKVRRFFILLENDSMIVTKSQRKTTHLTVCNYDSYQSEKNESESKVKHKRNATETQVTPNKNEENEENEKEKNKFNFRKSLIELGIEDVIASDWLKVRSKKKLSNTETAFNRVSSQIDKCKLNANDCIKIAVEKSWGGFEADWINNLNTSNLHSNVLKGDNLKPHMKNMIL